MEVHIYAFINMNIYICKELDNEYLHGHVEHIFFYSPEHGSASLIMSKV